MHEKCFKNADRKKCLQRLHRPLLVLCWRYMSLRYLKAQEEVKRNFEWESLYSSFGPNFISGSPLVFFVLNLLVKFTFYRPTLKTEDTMLKKSLILTIEDYAINCRRRSILNIFFVSNPFKVTVSCTT